MTRADRTRTPRPISESERRDYVEQLRRVLREANESPARVRRIPSRGDAWCRLSDREIADGLAAMREALEAHKAAEERERRRRAELFEWAR
jgi:hypothetical protein